MTYSRNNTFRTFRSDSRSDIMDGVATKRECVFAIFIVGVLITLGCLLHNIIVRSITDHNLRVEQTIQITDDEQFKHCLNTSVGAVYAEGDLDAYCPVEDEKGNISGKFWSIVRRYQEYTMHTRTVYYTDSKGKEHSRIEHYWTWDTISTHRGNCKGAIFCGVRFNINKIELSYWNDSHAPVKIDHNKRYVYSTIPQHHHGTLITVCKDNTICDHSPFEVDATPKSVHDSNLIGSWPIYLYWFCVIVAVGCIVYWFLMMDNRWLESKGSIKQGINICR